MCSTRTLTICQSSELKVYGNKNLIEPFKKITPVVVYLWPVSDLECRVHRVRLYFDNNKKYILEKIYIRLKHKCCYRYNVVCLEYYNFVFSHGFFEFIAGPKSGGDRRTNELLILHEPIQ